MKNLFILFIAVLLPAYTIARCSSGCYCSSDDDCDYYCNSYSVCQRQLPPGNVCSGYYIHPRECGSGYYCSSTSYTCQSQKSNGNWCSYDYECSSGYCSLERNSCQPKSTPFDWMNYIVWPGVAVTILLTLIFMTILMRRQRRRACAYYNTPYVVLPSSTPYSYQNSYIVGETPPPPYPGPISTPSPKPYQS